MNPNGAKKNVVTTELVEKAAPEEAIAHYKKMEALVYEEHILNAKDLKHVARIHQVNATLLRRVADKVYLKLREDHEYQVEGEKYFLAALKRRLWRIKTLHQDALNATNERQRREAIRMADELDEKLTKALMDVGAIYKAPIKLKTYNLNVDMNAEELDKMLQELQQ